MVWNLGSAVQRRTDLCDLTIKIQEKTVAVHKLILALKSEYFTVMFYKHYQESKQDTIDLTHAVSSFDDFIELLNFMYTGEITIYEDSVEDTLDMASFFLMDDIKEACAVCMTKMLCPENCLRYFRLADMCNMKNLSMVCQDMVMHRFRDYVVYTDDVLELPGELFQKLGRAGVFDLMKGHELRQFLLRWMKHSPTDRFKTCVDLIGLLSSHRHLDEPLVNLLEELNSGVKITQEKLNLELSKENSMPATEKTYLKALVIYKFSYDYKPEFANRPFVMDFCLYVAETDTWYQPKQKILISEEQTDSELLGFTQDYGVLKVSTSTIVLFSLIPDTVVTGPIFSICERRINSVIPIKWTDESEGPSLTKTGPKVERKEYIVFGGRCICLKATPSHNDLQAKSICLSLYEADPDTHFWVLQNYKIVSIIKSSKSSRFYPHCQIKALVVNDSLFACCLYVGKIKMVKISRTIDGQYLVEEDSQTYTLATNFGSSEYPFKRIKVLEDKIFMKIDWRCVYYIISERKWQMREQPLMPQRYHLQEQDLPLSTTRASEKMNTDCDFLPKLWNDKVYDSGFMAYSVPPKSNSMWIGKGLSDDNDEISWLAVSPPPKGLLHYSSKRLVQIHVNVLEKLTAYSKMPDEDSIVCPYNYFGIQADNQNTSLNVGHFCNLVRKSPYSTRFRRSPECNYCNRYRNCIVFCGDEDSDSDSDEAEDPWENMFEEIKRKKYT